MGILEGAVGVRGRDCGTRCWLTLCVYGGVKSRKGGDAKYGVHLKQHGERRVRAGSLSTLKYRRWTVLSEFKLRWTWTWISIFFYIFSFIFILLEYLCKSYRPCCSIGQYQIDPKYAICDIRYAGHGGGERWGAGYEQRALLYWTACHHFVQSVRYRSRRYFCSRSITSASLLVDVNSTEIEF